MADQKGAQNQEIPIPNYFSIYTLGIRERSDEQPGMIGSISSHTLQNAPQPPEGFVQIFARAGRGGIVYTLHSYFWRREKPLLGLFYMILQTQDHPMMKTSDFILHQVHPGTGEHFCILIDSLTTPDQLQLDNGSLFFTRPRVLNSKCDNPPSPREKSAEGFTHYYVELIRDPQLSLVRRFMFPVRTETKIDAAAAAYGYANGFCQAASRRAPLELPG